jgi:Uma2 family endonuclease
MVNPLPQITTVPTDTWFAADWEAFLTFAKDPTLVNGRFYYDHGYMRIEMSPLGMAHGSDNSIISTLVVLYATVKMLAFKELTNTSFRKTGVQEVQPDLAFYIGEGYKALPRSNAPVNLDQTPPPTLVVEIAATSLEDDLDRKQTLYQQLGVQEYWVVNVNASQVRAFSLAKAVEIITSEVLPNLPMALVEAALRRSQTEDDGAVSRWLLESFRV